MSEPNTTEYRGYKIRVLPFPHLTPTGHVVYGWKVTRSEWSHFSDRWYRTGRGALMGAQAAVRKMRGDR